jgi:hypothetical protein
MGKKKKDNVSVVFRQLSSGEVIGEIIDERGVIVESKNFGVMTEEKFERVLDFVNGTDPKLAGKIVPMDFRQTSVTTGGKLLLPFTSGKLLLSLYFFSVKRSSSQ